MASETRAAIEAAIPHRTPFLFVDRVLERTRERIVTEWDVSPALDALRGHYPGEPVVPGVLICEFAFQSAALCFSWPGVPPAPRPGGAIPVLTRIEDARFKKIVRPGETLRAEITLVENLGTAHYFSAHVRSGGESVLRVRFAVALAAPAAPLAPFDGSAP